MIQTVKKVLSIGFLLGIFVFGVQSGSAQTNRYDCSRFNDSLFECRLSNKCEVGEKNDKNSLGETITVKYCKLQEEEVDNKKKYDAIAAADSECSKTVAEYENDTRFSKEDINSLKAVCNQVSKTGTENDCEEKLDPRQTMADWRDDSHQRSLLRKFKRACKDDVQARIDKAEAGLSATALAEEAEYAPFGVYEGASFGGPGLKAGSRIAKSKLDNTENIS